MIYLKFKATSFQRFIILIVFLHYLTLMASAQSIYERIGRLPVTSYAPEEYGGSPFVITAIQSEQGLMYIGTETGLHEYDGHSWRFLFKRNEYKPILSLAKDAKGRIFYAGLDFGYLEADLRGETRPVSLLHMIPEELRSNIQITSIHFLDEFIMLQTLTHTHRLELSENFTLKSYRSWSTDTRFAIGTMIDNEYFVRQLDKGLFRLEGDELQLISGTESLGKEPLAVILPFPGTEGKTMLLGGQISGFYLFDGSSLSKFPTEVDQLIKAGALLQAGLLHEGNIILGFLGGGVVMMNPKGEILRSITTNSGLPSDGVYSLYFDRSGGLWVTTEDGIARIAVDSPILSFGKESGINSEIRYIQKKGEELYLGTNTGLQKFDQRDSQFKLVPQIENSEILYMESDGENLIVPGRSLQVIRDGKAIRLDFPQDGSRPITSYIPKNNPNLLLVGATNGLLVYQRGLSKEYPWEYKGKVPGVESIGNYFFEDHDGMVFTIGEGKLLAINPGEFGLETDDPTRIKVNVFEADMSKFRFSLMDGELYINSSDGFQKYSSMEGKFVPTDDFKEVGKDIFDFNQHQSGILWYESIDQKKHILKRNAEGKFVKDERPNVIAPYLSIADFIDEDSIFWFGSARGLIRYDPKKDNQTDKAFFTLIRRIETKTDTLPLIAYGRDKTLPAREMKDNSYLFEFAAPYFEEEKKTKYQTFLEGFEADWVDWNDNKFKEYTNLSPGDYTFHVRAMAYTGRISEEAVYSFVVLPPWYATWWAYLFFTLLIGGIITAIVKWRSQKLKAENQILEERVKERTTELEKSYQNVELLGEIGRKITSSLSAEKIIATVYTNVNALMDASVFGIGIYQEETQTLEFPATYENGEALTPYSNSLKDPNRLSALCFNTGNEIVINNLNEEYSKYLQKMPTPSRGEAPVSLIYLPLKVKGQMIGVITVQSFNKNAFTEYHLYMLRTIAVYTAIALENAESFQNLQQTLSSLKDTQAQLIQSEKMASLGELTAGIAHEIQNPLNFVNNFSELNVELVDELKEELAKLQLDPSLKGELESLANDIIQNQQKINHHGNRAGTIVKGMLAHSRNGAGEKELTDINALSDEYLRLSYHGLRAKDKSFNADFKTDFDPNLPKVNGLPQDIGRVLLNLINNAFQACAMKDLPGFVSDDKKNLEGLKPLVTVSTKNLGDKIEISVKDNGPGIPTEIKDKIFQPFFTTKPTGQGTGLGLSLSYDIIKAHGGEIGMESEVGKGTEFKITLPV